MSHAPWPHGGMQAPISSRHGLNPDHNIWNNNGTWWVHFTVHHPDHTKERIRRSLGTKDRLEARRRRDIIMGGTVSIAARLPHRQSAATPGRTWTPFETWKVSYGLAADADPSTPIGPDGVPLLVEYALGMNPLEPDPQKLPRPMRVSHAGEDYAALEFTQSKNSPDATVTGGVSEELASWDYRPEATVLVSRTEDPGGLTETLVIRDAVPAPTTGVRFLKVRAVGTP